PVRGATPLADSRRRLFLVVHRGLVHVMHGEPRLPHTTAQVDFLEIQEEPLVEEAGALERGSTHHYRGAGDPVHLARVPRRRARHDPRVEQPRHGPELQGGLELAQNGGETKRRGRGASFRTEHARAGDSSVWSRLEKARERPQGAGANARIGVQEEEELRRVRPRERVANADVVAEAEAAVVARRENADAVAPPVLTHGALEVFDGVIP